MGMIYRRFFTVCSSNCLLQLYISYVRPLLEYAAPVWDPHYAVQKEKLEKVQRFALKMSSKRWSERYVSLIEWSGIPMLEEDSAFSVKFYTMLSITRMSPLTVKWMRG